MHSVFIPPCWTELVVIRSVPSVTQTAIISINIYDLLFVGGRFGVCVRPKASSGRFGIDRRREECLLHPLQDGFQTIVVRSNSVLGANLIRRLCMEAELIHQQLSQSLFNTHGDGQPHGHQRFHVPVWCPVSEPGKMGKIQTTERLGLLSP